MQEKETRVSISSDVAAVQAIGAVPTIMRVVAETTGLRFVCIARVTQDSWTTCALLDQIGFGLNPGDELVLATTICHEVRQQNAIVVIDKVSDDPVYCDHPTPKMYGFESYFSIPVYRKNGEFFGTLCGLDPLPAQLSNPKILDTLTLFAELISRQLESEERLSESEHALRLERENTELREQFIAVLGHDLRTPLSSMVTGAEVLKRLLPDPKAAGVIERMQRSGKRIARLIDDVMDFARGRMGGGLPVHLRPSDDLARHLQHVVAELRSTHETHTIETDIVFDRTVVCDQERVGQLLSNLLTNALVHGAKERPVRVTARCEHGVLSVAVSNSGEPIPAEKMSRLFQPFWRGAGENAHDGLGLGLYIAAEIARSHQGALTVVSDPLATTFTFTAPAVG